MNEDTKAPTTVKEVGIHIGYMSRSITELKSMVENLSHNFASKEEVKGLQASAELVHKELEDRIVLLETKTSSYTMVEKVVFTGLGFVLLSVLGAVIGLVILK